LGAIGKIGKIGKGQHAGRGVGNCSVQPREPCEKKDTPRKESHTQGKKREAKTNWGCGTRISALENLNLGSFERKRGYWCKRGQRGHTGVG